MSAFGMESFGEISEVAVEVYTSAYRVAGTVHTRFTRVAEILNQLTATHLPIEQAIVSEHADAEHATSAPTAIVAVDHILLIIAPDLAGEARADMRIEKRAVRAQLDIPPLRITGSIHVPLGGRPMDGLLNVADRFMAVTDVTITSAAYPHLERSADALALRRDRAHVLIVGDDLNPDVLLANVLDERTAESWLRGGDEPS